ncbi:MAG TPA: hypothetical protein VMV45_15010 [Casimicrobiaceae bacterium]|nr:hypothetical protein [Casimicrobiaceae bacterium]
MHLSTGAIVALALGTSVSPHAADMSAFAGTWVIASEVVAPWADPGQPPGREEPRRLIGKQVRFTPARVIGPAPIGCAAPVYKVEDVGPDMIFEGELAERRDGTTPDALASATRLGFAHPDRIVTLDAGCTELQFHELRPGALAFGLNNRVYTMQRK